MQIVKTFGQSLYEPKFGTHKAVSKQGTEETVSR